MSALISWAAPLDPSEVKDYSHSFEAELTKTDDKLLTSTFILPTDASAAGLEIDSQFVTPTGGTAFFDIKTANQSDAAWENGVTFRIRHQITTAGGRTYERSINLTVKQL